MRFQLSTVRRDVWWPGRAGPQHGVMTTLLTSFVLVVAGLCAGTGARLLLRRLRRGTRVPPPWCELGVASAWGASGAAAVPVRWLPVLLALGWLAVAAGTVDVLAGRLPDALTLPALPTALLLLVPVGGDAVARGVAGAVVAVAAHAAVHFVAPAAMGGGDVKLAAPLGAVSAAVSWEALALAGVLAALSSGVLAVAVLVRRGRGGAVPHGPSMLLACLLVAAAGARGP
jgi:leader peptidase (prepilin peptidase) / N-methyltransferase